MLFKKSLQDELLKFIKKDRVRAHMPGHNGGAGLSSGFKRNAFKLDVTEFDETDNLQNPNGIILKSEERAAKAFGAKKSFFLVNGSTVGIEAAVLTAVRNGDKLIVDRTCHKAVISGMILAGAEPIFIEPEYIERFGIYGAMSPITVMDALRNNPDAVGVVLTSPNYYGICSDIKRLAKNIHSSDKFLIVDEAHGAHFAFSDELPKPALESGADLVIHSAHKTLPALGQTALIHVGNTELVDVLRLRRNINLLQTSSPSYILLASIDEAVSKMSNEYGKQLNRVIETVTAIKSKIGVLDKVSCMTRGNLDNDYDITKLAVDFSKLGITGYGAAELLKKDYGIYPEMADERNVLLYITASTTKKDLELIDRAITDISKSEYRPQVIKKPKPMPHTRFEMPMKEAFFSDSVMISAESAIGKIYAEIVNSCPPCCPIVLPGQIIDNSVVEYLKEYTDIEKIAVVSNSINSKTGQIEEEG